MNIAVQVVGFTVHGVPDVIALEDVEEVARDIASDIGMRLSDLGRECRHGHVTIAVGKVKVTT